MNTTGRSDLYSARRGIGRAPLIAWLLWMAVHTSGSSLAAAAAPVSPASQACIDCHEVLQPGLVADWRRSRHAATTPATALKAEGLARKVSSTNVPPLLLEFAVGCAECHTIDPSRHADTFDHFDAKVHVVVSPPDCATCHAEEKNQFDGNLMSHAHDNLLKNAAYHHLVTAVNGIPAATNAHIHLQASGDDTAAESCLYCHGTRLEVKGAEERDTDAGSLEFPIIDGWPNQGVGRVNPDGSRGACTACHARHQFSMAMARQPYTCKECHVGPDVPAFKVYETSKHGNIFSTHGKSWDFDPTPWAVGRDFTAPTCAACHMSLVVDPGGDVLARRSHEIKDRLSMRLFGLIYAHPHPRHADTTTIRNRDGLPLPTDFAGGYATNALRDPSDVARTRTAMKTLCRACHDSGWVENHYRRLDHTILETNQRTLAATRIMEEIWKRGLATGLDRGGNPFDEYPEIIWSDGWLFHANTIRFASAMAGGGDYGVFADGRYHAARNLQQLADWLQSRRLTASTPETQPGSSR